MQMSRSFPWKAIVPRYSQSANPMTNSAAHCLRLFFNAVTPSNELAPSFHHRPPQFQAVAAGVRSLDLVPWSMRQGKFQNTVALCFGVRTPVPERTPEPVDGGQMGQAIVPQNLGQRHV